MKKILFTIICIVLLTSCNDEIDLSGRDGISKFLQNDFSGISVQDGFELYLNRGNSSTAIKDTIKIESDENVLNHVKYKIKNNVLYFYKEQGIEFPSGVSVKISVTKDSLDALIISSSSKVQITDTVRTTELRLVCLDQSVLTGRLECKTIQSSINNSTIEITGVSDTVQMNIDNGSSVKLLGMESNNARINISGGSFAEIAVSNEIEIKARERSILRYKGTAIVRSLTLDDDSEVKKLDE
jgi:hypothetical protein